MSHLGSVRLSATEISAMTAWAAIRRFLGAVALLGAMVAPARPAEPLSKTPPPRAVKPTPAQYREIAEKAEKAGDWEAAFNAYCHLFVIDRNTPDLREKLTTAFRHVQQLRRHRDPNFQQFATGMTYGSGLDLFAEVVQRVPSAYVERERATPQNLWRFAVEELDRALGDATFRQAFLDSPRAEKITEFRAELRRDWSKRGVKDHTEARTRLRQLISAAQDAFIVRFPSALAVECACGACSGLDEYTVFLTPTQPGAEALAVPDLSAAGLYLAVAKDGVVVQGVVPNSWVDLTHPELRRGTRIVKINGRTIGAGGLAVAADALRNPGPDGFHQFEVRPPGDAATVLARIPVAVPTVYGAKLLNPKEIGYARIGSFAPSTPCELDEAINHLKAEGARAIVLDLRGNHGGSFLAGVDTARRLLPAGLIVTTQGQASGVDNQVFSSMSGMSAHDIKLILLIDAETASAAEVLAAALKDNNRARLVGMPTFGKGTVQYPLRMETLDEVDPSGKRISKSGTVRVTIAKLIAPRSGPINGAGVMPHYLEAEDARQLELAIEKALEELQGSEMRLPPQMIPQERPTLDPNP
jgi:C-terminal peptidase prc